MTSLKLFFCQIRLKLPLSNDCHILTVKSLWVLKLALWKLDIGNLNCTNHDKISLLRLKIYLWTCLWTEYWTPWKEHCFVISLARIILISWNLICSAICNMDFLKLMSVGNSIKALLASKQLQRITQGNAMNPNLKIQIIQVERSQLHAEFRIDQFVYPRI